MEINIICHDNSSISSNSINVIIESNTDNKSVNNFINYIQKYNSEIIVRENNELLKIHYTDIFYCYGKGKDVYYKTEKSEYKLKSRLYEIEQFSKDFIRISKSCVVNFAHAKKFDMSMVGSIIIELSDGTKLKVSRRRVIKVIDYLDERSW